MSKRSLVGGAVGIVILLVGLTVFLYGRPSSLLSFSTQSFEDTSAVPVIVSASVFEPRIAPNGGTFYDSVKVTLGDATPRSSLRYTIDGTDPVDSSTAQVYTGTFTLVKSATVRTSPDLAAVASGATATANFAIVASDSVTWHDAPPPNGSDDTETVQVLLNHGGNIRFGAGTYTVRPLFVASNSVIQFSPQTILRAKSGGYPNDTDSLLSIIDKENVTLYGNNGRIEMLKPEYTSGEWRMGLSIQSSQHVYVEALASNDSGGDGFFVGAARDRAKDSSLATFSSDVVLTGVSADNNRRTGLAIVSGRNITVSGATFTRTNGTPTQSGIDIEPDGKEYVIQGLLFEHIVTEANEGLGISIALSALSGSGKSTDITIRGHKDTGSLIGLLLGKVYHPLVGQITIEDATWSQSAQSGFRADRYGLDGPRVDVIDTTVSDPYTERSVPGHPEQSAKPPTDAAAYDVLWSGTLASGSAYANIHFDHPTATRTTTATHALHAFAFSAAASTGALPRVDIIAPKVVGIPDDAMTVYPPPSGK